LGASSQIFDVILLYFKQVLDSCLFNITHFLTTYIVF
jgi:hypothetical protein